MSSLSLYQIANTTKEYICFSFKFKTSSYLLGLNHSIGQLSIFLIARVFSKFQRAIYTCF